MSYILDALRKSDQQRQSGAAPTLMSAPLPVQESRRRTPLRLVALAAVLFTLGIVIGWWRPWQANPPRPTEQAGTTADELAPHQAEASAPAAAPAPVSVTPLPHDVGENTESNHAPSRQPKYLPAPSGLPVAGSTRATGLAAGNAVVAAVGVDKTRADVAKPPTTLGQEAPGKPVATEQGPGTTEQKIMSRAELPASIQQEIPKMSVALHAYSSKPRNRLVSVNDQLLHEGDALSPGLVLEQITAEDMVFSYKGFRFRQGVR